MEEGGAVAALGTDGGTACWTGDGCAKSVAAEEASGPAGDGAGGAARWTAPFPVKGRKRA